MKDITVREEVLKLNKNHQPVGFFCPKDIFICLANWKVNKKQDYILDKQGKRIRKMLAYDIKYPKLPDNSYDFEAVPYMRLVDWDTWITLPVRSYDLVVNTPRQQIRVPRVVMSLLSDDMPKKRYGTDFSSIYEIYAGIDQYTKRKISKNEASRDHIIPKSRGGKTEHSNLVLSSKHINTKKGSKLNHEIGLPQVTPIIPKSLPVSALLKNTKNIPEWRYFLLS